MQPGNLLLELFTAAPVVGGAVTFNHISIRARRLQDVPSACGHELADLHLGVPPSCPAASAKLLTTLAEIGRLTLELKLCKSGRVFIELADLVLTS